MGDLAVLRTAKLAMTEGLITQDDFDQIKVAFLKAQQIKAGLDAGFIREEDYVQARDSFLHSLDFRTAMTHHTHAPAPATAPAPAAPATTSMPPPPPVRVPPINAPSIPASGGTGLTSRGSSGMLSASPTAAQAAAVGNALASARGPSPSGGASAGSAGGGSGSSGGGTVAVPTDLPRIGKPGASSGKKSMSGIGLNDQCINIFNYIKTKSQYKWVTFKIDDGGNEVVVEQLGAADSSYEQFTAALPDNQPRYAVYDYAYTNADTGQTINKLVFLHWAPEGSTIKSKMMYASTKDFLKGFLEGVGAELQADSFDELSENEMRDRVSAALTRK